MESQRMNDDYQFTVDWTSHHFNDWRTWLGHLVDRPAMGCEIGSFEGRSAVFWMEEILTHESSSLLCIDPWGYAEEQEICRGGLATNLPLKFDFERIYRTFQHNTRHWANRIATRRASSREVLPSLADCRLDFAYIDGCHLACRALEDAVLVWPKLRPGGIVILDDYDWTSGMEPPPGWNLENLHPKLGIDAFLQVYHGQYDRAEIRGGQAMVRKR
jgi:hypothetical protein